MHAAANLSRDWKMATGSDEGLETDPSTQDEVAWFIQSTPQTKTPIGIRVTLI